MKQKMGIRHKIILGFCSLAVLLFFSGLMSYFELSKLSRSSQNMLDISMKNMALSKALLDAAEQENTTFLDMIIVGEPDSSLLLASRTQFDQIISRAHVSIRDLARLDSIFTAHQRYIQVVDQHLQRSRQGDPLESFSQTYKTSYQKLTGLIKNFMVSSPGSMEAKATQLKNNAYRAIMPGVIALAVAILIIFIFFYLIDIYYIRPVLQIKQGLYKYINSRVPFRVNFEGRDEVHQLKELIEQLIEQLKNKKND